MTINLNDPWKKKKNRIDHLIIKAPCEMLLQQILASVNLADGGHRSHVHNRCTIAKIS